MTTETTWQPPLGYTGTRQDAEKLAIARQQMAYENSLAPRPQWEELTPHQREMSILDAANMLTAMRRAGLLTAEPINWCVLCAGREFVGRDCIDGIWLCQRHSKVVAMKRFELTDADLERRGRQPERGTA